jgi:hypothetical protein
MHPEVKTVAKTIDPTGQLRFLSVRYYHLAPSLAGQPLTPDVSHGMIPFQIGTIPNGKVKHGKIATIKRVNGLRIQATIKIANGLRNQITIKVTNGAVPQLPTPTMV